MTSVGVEPVGVAAEEHLAEAVDGAKRRAQIVRDGVAERFKLCVCSPELVRAVVHALLELLREAAQLVLDRSASLVKLHRLEREREVGRHSVEQLDLFLVEEPWL